MLKDRLAGNKNVMNQNGAGNTGEGWSMDTTEDRLSQHVPMKMP